MAIGSPVERRVACSQTTWSRDGVRESWKREAIREARMHLILSCEGVGEGGKSIRTHEPNGKSFTIPTPPFISYSSSSSLQFVTSNKEFGEHTLPSVAQDSVSRFKQYVARLMMSESRHAYPYFHPHSVPPPSPAAAACSSSRMRDRTRIPSAVTSKNRSAARESSYRR